MKTKFLTYVRQITPENSGSYMQLRTSHGIAGVGRHVAWVRLPQGQPGFKSRPGFGRLYFDWLGDQDIWGSSRNDVATALLHQPDTQIVGAPDLDPSSVALFGTCWLHSDEGYRCPVVKLRFGHEYSEILNWIDEQGFGGFAEIHDDHKDIWLVQTSSDEDIVRCHAEMIAELEADGEDLTDEDRVPPNGSAFMMMAKLRWG